LGTKQLGGRDKIIFPINSIKKISKEGRSVKNKPREEPLKNYTKKK